MAQYVQHVTVGAMCNGRSAPGEHGVCLQAVRVESPAGHRGVSNYMLVYTLANRGDLPREVTAWNGSSYYFLEQRLQKSVDVNLTPPLALDLELLRPHGRYATLCSRAVPTEPMCRVRLLKQVGPMNRIVFLQNLITAKWQRAFLVKCRSERL